MPWLGFLGLGFRGICLGWGVSVGLGDLPCYGLGYAIIVILYSLVYIRSLK
jgi:hypothetical protein